jgi:hypothetical protein
MSFGRNRLQPSLICYCICRDELSKATKCVNVNKYGNYQALELQVQGRKIRKIYDVGKKDENEERVREGVIERDEQNDKKREET